jgi:DNA-binding XRE family transcriptional regulator
MDGNIDLLFALRRRNGLTQDQLARQSGVAKRTIQHIELGRTVPKLDTAQSLASALGVGDPIAIVEGAGLLRRLNTLLPKLYAGGTQVREEDVARMPPSIATAITAYGKARLANDAAQAQLDAASRRCGRSLEALKAVAPRECTDPMFEERNLANNELADALAAVQRTMVAVVEASIQLQSAYTRLYFQ